METRVLLKSSLMPFQDNFLAVLKEGRWCTLNISYLMQNFAQNDIVQEYIPNKKLVRDQIYGVYSDLSFRYNLH
jgi:hypothetical protein